MAIVRGHTTITEQDMNSARRVARQTAIPKRLLLVEAIQDSVSTEIPIREVVNQTGMLYNSLRIEMFKARPLGILDFREEIEYGEAVRRGNEWFETIKSTSYFISLNPDFKPFVDATTPVRGVEP